ncbi:MAG: ATP-binding cassette domain-containing protein, partial [Phycisphaerae bacterium]
MSPSHSRQVALSVQGLTVTLPTGRRLFDVADIEIHTGELVLLVGPSGSGKTTLLRLIAELDEPGEYALQVSGRIVVAGRYAAVRADGRIGLVFQNHALFDELSAVDNVQFALDHRVHGQPRETKEAETILRRMGVPVPGKISELSGGERQRVAVARTLAQDPPILMFDEPTTGLDPVRAREVADEITRTHKSVRKTVIVVTHDYKSFLPYKPRFILLDSNTGKLRTVDEAQLDAEFEAQAKADITTWPAAGPSVIRGASTAGAVAWVESPGRVLLMFLASVVAVTCGWRRPKWKMRYLWHYLRMVALGTTALYVAIAGVMLGFVFI